MPPTIAISDTKPNIISAPISFSFFFFVFSSMLQNALHLHHGRAIVSKRAVKPGLPYEIHFLLKLKIMVKVSHRASFILAFTGFAPNATFLFALLLLLIVFTRYSKNNPSTTHFLQFIV